MRELKILFIMNPYETLNCETETSLLLMEELLSRGVGVYWCELSDLVLYQNELSIISHLIMATSPFQKGKHEKMPIHQFDAVVTRLDPPFDETYLQLTYLLDFIPSTVKQFNRADALRAFNEKLLPLHWPNHTPATITTMNEAALEEFLDDKKDIIIKPLDDCSGRGIKRFHSDMENKSGEISNVFWDAFGRRRFVTAQEFLPNIQFGDKRVFLVGGQVVGIVNRVPAKGSYLGNIHQGAHCEAARLTDDEKAILENIIPFLTDNGVFLAGADFIDGKLTELNITSPSAVRQINEVSEKDIHPIIVDMMLAEMNKGMNLLEHAI